MSYDTNVSDRPIGHQQSMFQIEILPVAGCAVGCLLYESKIF